MMVEVVSWSLRDWRGRSLCWIRSLAARRSVRLARSCMNRSRCYDTKGRLLEFFNPTGVSTRYESDSFGRQSATLGPAVSPASVGLVPPDRLSATRVYPGGFGLLQYFASDLCSAWGIIRSEGKEFVPTTFTLETVDLECSGLTELSSVAEPLSFFCSLVFVGGVSPPSKKEKAESQKRCRATAL
jgi:YD repeat-containing protein